MKYCWIKFNSRIFLVSQLDNKKKKECGGELVNKLHMSTCSISRVEYNDGGLYNFNIHALITRLRVFGYHPLFTTCTNDFIYFLFAYFFFFFFVKYNTTFYGCIFHEINSYVVWPNSLRLIWVNTNVLTFIYIYINYKMIEKKKIENWISSFWLIYRDICQWVTFNKLFPHEFILIVAIV